MALQPIGHNALIGGHVRQFFVAGSLEPGTYPIRYDGALSRELEDPTGSVWGPGGWTITCTLVIER